MKDFKIILWLAIFNPIGLYKMYKDSDWSDSTKYIITVLVGLADVALVYNGFLFYGLFYSSIFIFIIGLISLIMSFNKKSDKKVSVVILVAGILLFGGSTYQIAAEEARQVAIEEQQRQELLEKRKKEEQRLQIEEATAAVEEAEEDKTRNRYIKADNLLQKIYFEHPELSELSKRLEVLDSLLTKEENFKKAKLALEKAEESQTEKDYETALLLINGVDVEGTDFEERLALVKEVVDADNLIKEEIAIALEEAKEKKDRGSYEEASILIATLTASDSNLADQLIEVEEIIVDEEERVAAEQAEKERIAAEQAEKERVAAEQAEKERVAAEQAEASRIAARAVETPKSDNIGRVVYIAPQSGTKYHFSENCRGLNRANSIEKMDLNQAKAQGYDLCGWEN